VRRLLLALLFAAAACHSPTAPETVITGTVHYFTLEGGFWAVQGDDGKVYDPASPLPSGFQQENLHVMVLIRTKEDAVSVHMVGSVVDILQIQAI